MRSFFKVALVAILSVGLVAGGILAGCAAMRQGAVDGARDAAQGNPPAPFVVTSPTAPPAGGPSPAPSTPDLLGHAIVYAIVYGVGTTLKELIKNRLKPPGGDV